MRDFLVRADIAASPEAVWAVLADVEHWPEWTASMQRVTRLDSGPLAQGSHLRVEQPKLLPANFTITEWQENRNFTWVSQNPGSSAVAGHVIEATGSGCTVTLTIHFNGLFGGLVGWLMRGLIGRYMAMEAQGLKQRAGQSARPAAS
ncbi:MAG: hypothetical protein JWN73_4712 [Betaproteobacteria bacterium]|nr:hypothetical protein [Betaproteobacteria bacterium]